MKRSFFFLILFLLISPFCVYAEKEDITDFDGNTWQTWTALQNFNFISGFISAGHYLIKNNIQTQEEGYESAQGAGIYLSYALPDEKKPKNTFSRKEVFLLWGSIKEDFNMQLYKYAIIGITNGQIVDGLNILFTDFKNRQIKLDDAIYVIKKQIKGAPTEEIEAILQFLRADKDRNKLWYIDKGGKRKYILFP
jgi:hypothetical protein